MNARATIRDFVSGTYRTLVPELFAEPLNEERNATCDRCAMLPPDDPLFAPDEYFGPTTKCCTYHPLLPNYSVGGLLADESADGAEGRRRIREKIVHRIGVAPVGILPPRKHRLLYRHGRDGFGRAKALACPYLDQEHGRCTVWSHREAVCTTWFCKHNDGEDGRAFWNQLREYLLGVQFVLTVHALRELGFDADVIAASLPQNADLDARGLDDEPVSDEDHERLWGAWAGREQEFFSRAYDLVRALDRESVSALGGIRLELELDRLKKRYQAARSPVVPDPLVKNPSLKVRRGLDGSFIVVGYAGIDAMRLRKPFYELLDYFDGRLRNDEVNAAIFVERGVRLSATLFAKLYRHRILVDAAAR